MKIKKFNLAVIIVISILLVVLAGCSETYDNETPDDDRGTTAPITFVTDDQGYEIHRTVPSGVGIHDITNLEELVDEILEHIEIAETITENDEDYWRYSGSNMADITEFYIPNIEIPGFELYNVGILGGVFVFSYVPTNLDGVEFDREGNPEFSFSDTIRLSITRTDYEDFPSSPTIEELASQFNVSDQVIRNGIVYMESINLIAGLMGETCFTMRVPDSLNNFDTLHSLATQVVQSAELVVVADRR